MAEISVKIVDLDQTVETEPVEGELQELDLTVEEMDVRMMVIDGGGCGCGCGSCGMGCGCISVHG